MARKRSIDEEFQRDVSGSDLDLFLIKAGLPVSYPKLTVEAATKARRYVLASWFDPSQPQKLITNLRKFLQALFLWREYYVKPTQPGVYYYRDHDRLYHMLATVFGAPMELKEPNKALVQGTRRTGKTIPLVVEMMPFLCIVRPFSCCLLSEFNDKRTGEELIKIKTFVQENTRISSDFGDVYSQSIRKGKTWSNHHLQFTTFPGCEIMGHSIKSSQRGRGPIYGVLDDPEDEDQSFNIEYRRWFFDRLFGVYLPMFNEGSHICWIGTPYHAGSCLSLAFKDQSEQEEHEDALEDLRFRDWHKINYAVIQEQEPGKYISHQPDRMSVEKFLKKLEIDPVSARKEIMCLPVTPGARLFPYQMGRHGFMYCESGRAKDAYIVDFATGMKKPWDEFLTGLRTFVACDLTGGRSVDADPGAVVVVGVDNTGVVYVLDVFLQICGVPQQIHMAHELAERWRCEVLAWEKVGFQCVVEDVTKEVRVERMNEGKYMPVVVAIDNTRHGRKPVRMQRLVHLFGENRIRFRIFEPATGPDGIRYTPGTYTNRGYYQGLMGQVREYTDRGIRGHDDAIDALEMAIRTAGPHLAEKRVTSTVDPLDDYLDRAESAGFNFPDDTIPPQNWNKRLAQKNEMIDEGVETLCVEVPYL